MNLLVVADSDESVLSLQSKIYLLHFYFVKSFVHANENSNCQRFS